MELTLVRKITHNVTFNSLLFIKVLKVSKRSLRIRPKYINLHTLQLPCSIICKAGSNLLLLFSGLYIVYISYNFSDVIQNCMKITISRRILVMHNNRFFKKNLRFQNLDRSQFKDMKNLLSMVKSTKKYCCFQHHYFNVKWKL